jgi:8-oxo-dGTP pyrophosphatase MutT (NUDIX family)
MLRELSEETGYAAELDEVSDPVFVWRTPDGAHTMERPTRATVQYVLFFGAVPDEFEPRLDGEHTQWEWLHLADLRRDALHPGVDLAVLYVRNGLR